MKLLYLDTGMGAAGDMLSAALLELFPADEQKKILGEINGCGLEGVHSETETVSRCGIKGTLMHVLIDGAQEEESSEAAEHHHEHHHDHHHAVHMDDIVRRIDSLKLPETVREDAKAVYQRIAAAEAKVHGAEVSEVHFHEVGMMDALADVITVSFLIRRLAPERICAGTVTTGFGSVHCMHGILPVPAPATEKLLEGIPVQAGTIEGELCTPTGAALLGYFVDDFGPMPPMIIQKSGYGCGKKEFPKANCVRALLGEMVSDGQPQGNILCINCNVDDMTPEEIAFATERIAAAGAAEVYTVPAGMKKGRPGIQITAFCAPDRKEAVLSAFFKHTSTIGVRAFFQTGYRMESRVRKLETPDGTVHIKESTGFNQTRRKADYDDAASLAIRENISLREARERIRAQEVRI